MTKKVTKADGTVTYVVEAFLDSIVEEGDTVEDMPELERQEPTAEEIANNLVAMENYEARKYLTETDWYVTRKYLSQNVHLRSHCREDGAGKGLYVKHKGEVWDEIWFLRYYIALVQFKEFLC